MMNTGGLSAADAVLLTDRNNGNGGGNGMWGDNGAWWVIILFLFIFAGWSGNGWNGGGGNAGTQGAITRSDLCMSESFQDVKREVQNANDAVNLGFANLNSTICNAAYENAGLINGLSNTVQQGFNATNVALLQGQNALSTQVAQCCCGLEKGQMQTQYEMAQNTCALQNTIQTGFRDSIEATNAGTRAILDYLCQDKISTLQSENQSLKNSISQANQNTLLTNAMSAQTAQLIQRIAPYPIPAYVVTQPTASYYNGYGFGCGCNTGCGCGCGSVA